MADKYSGPNNVLERGNKVWKIQVGKRVDVDSKDRLKPHLGSVAQGAVPPKDGLCGFCGSKARGACVAARDYISPGDDCIVNPPRICIEMHEIFM